MDEPRDPAHYLKRLKTTTVPKRLAWLACESDARPEQGLTVERFKRAAFGTTHFTSRKGERVDDMLTTDDPAWLWSYIDGFCTPGRRVVLWVHDLPFQLRVSQGLLHLPTKGWHLDSIVLEKQAAWASFRNSERSLLMCDLRSWTPVGLQRIVSDLAGAGNAPVNQAERGDGWHGKAWLEAVTVREAVLQILAWIEGNDLGQFRPTGSGQSYTAFRRRFMQHKLLVHDDIELLQVERAAMWTGRCEAWRHGALANGPFVEYDMKAAYCQIAADTEVPSMRQDAIYRPTYKHVLSAMETHCVLADVTVTTTVPCVPTKMGNRTVWPVGTFRTYLWDPEIALLAFYAKDVRVHRAWRYTRAPALQTFARWTLDGMNSDDRGMPPLARRVLKHWSRSLVGRFGLRYRTWEHFGQQPTPDLRLVTFIDTDDGTSTDMLIAGNDRLILTDMREGAESLPQVPGYIMSECRRRLWNAMVNVGIRGVVYCDTDSIIVDCGSSGRAMSDRVLCDDGTWTVKGEYRSMHIYGPRNIVAEEVRRVAGLPLTARQVAPLEFSGQVMRSIKESMRSGQLDCVASVPRKFVLDAPDMRRRHIEGGRTAPFVVQPKREDGEDAAYWN